MLAALHRTADPYPKRPLTGCKVQSVTSLACLQLVTLPQLQLGASRFLRQGTAPHDSGRHATAPHHIFTLQAQQAKCSAPDPEQGGRTCCPFTTCTCSAEPGVVDLLQAAAVYSRPPCRPMPLTAPAHCRPAWELGRTITQQHWARSCHRFQPRLCPAGQQRTRNSFPLSTKQQAEMEAAGRSQCLTGLSTQPSKQLEVV